LNPDIQLAFRTYYCNDQIGKDIGTAFTEAAGQQFATFYLSGGDYQGSDVIINNESNWNIVAPYNSGTQCLYGDLNTPRNLTITNSTRICVNNLDITGSLGISGSGGSHKFNRCSFRDDLFITGINGSFVTFENCEFANNKTISFLNGLGGACYFLNCNFNNCNFVCNQPSAQQVIIYGCTGLASLDTPVKRTISGINATSTGVSQVSSSKVLTSDITTDNIKTSTINNSFYPLSTFMGKGTLNGQTPPMAVFTHPIFSNPSSKLVIMVQKSSFLNPANQEYALTWTLGSGFLTVESTYAGDNSDVSVIAYQISA
jgi:hypothetical protein